MLAPVMKSLAGLCCMFVVFQDVFADVSDIKTGDKSSSMENSGILMYDIVYGR